MDGESIRAVKEELKQIAAREDIGLEKVLFFGSRVRGDYSEGSDNDVNLFSEDFEGVEWYRRGGEFQRQWDYGRLPTPEIICVTPEEFEERRKKLGDVVRRAVEEGISA